MSEIRVENEIVMRKISEIKPYVRNPRKNDKTVDLLCEIIPKVGFNVPLVIDKDGVIVKGHARFAAAIRLGMTELPCIVTHADEAAIKADRITDNKISEFSEWVNDELMHEVDMIDLNIDFADFGLPVPTFDDIPTFDDFAEEDTQVTDEQREKLYAEFLEKQAKENAVNVQITSQKDIEKAVERQSRQATSPPQYYKCVCEKCGHIMFVEAKDVWSPET